MGVRLREVHDADLDAFFEHQRDADAVAQAVAVARDREEFDAWWGRMRANPETLTLSVMDSDGRPVGWVSSFAHGEHREIAGWGGRRGEGIGSEALRLFLDVEVRRPVRSATHPGNAAARRVLEKLGFAQIGVDDVDGFVLYELA